MGKLPIISEETVRKIVTHQLAFDAVRGAFEAVEADRARLFDVVIGTGLNRCDLNTRPLPPEGTKLFASNCF
jgi:hypothetical protein